MRALRRKPPRPSVDDRERMLGRTSSLSPAPSGTLPSSFLHQVPRSVFPLDLVRHDARNLGQLLRQELSHVVRRQNAQQMVFVTTTGSLRMPLLRM